MGFENLSEKEIYTALSALSKDKGNWETELERIAVLLNYPSNKIKAKTLWLLGEMGLLYPQKVQPFIKRIADMLFDENDKIRERAIGALGRVGRNSYALIAPYMGDILKKAEDEAHPVRMNFIWAAENIAVNYPEAFANSMALFAVLLDDHAIRVRMEAPEIFRVIGKRKPEMVLPYIEKLKFMSEHDENSVVRIHSAGAVKATIGKAAV
jgi:HEAT repeat protein